MIPSSPIPCHVLPCSNRSMNYEAILSLRTNLKKQKKNREKCILKKCLNKKRPKNPSGNGCHNYFVAWDIFCRQAWVNYVNLYLVPDSCSFEERLGDNVCSSVCSEIIDSFLIPILSLFSRQTVLGGMLSNLLFFERVFKLRLPNLKVVRQYTKYL